MGNKSDSCGVHGFHRILSYLVSQQHYGARINIKIAWSSFWVCRPVKSILFEGVGMLFPEEGFLEYLAVFQTHTTSTWVYRCGMERPLDCQYDMG